MNYPQSIEVLDIEVEVGKSMSIAELRQKTYRQLFSKKSQWIRSDQVFDLWFCMYYKNYSDYIGDIKRLFREHEDYKPFEQTLRLALQPYNQEVALYILSQDCVKQLEIKCEKATICD